MDRADAKPHGCPTGHNENDKEKKRTILKSVREKPQSPSQSVGRKQRTIPTQRPKFERSAKSQQQGELDAESSESDIDDQPREKIKQLKLTMENSENREKRREEGVKKQKENFTTYKYEPTTEEDKEFEKIHIVAIANLRGKNLPAAKARMTDKTKEDIMCEKTILQSHIY